MRRIFQRLKERVRDTVQTLSLWSRSSEGEYVCQLLLMWTFFSVVNSIWTKSIIVFCLRPSLLFKKRKVVVHRCICRLLLVVKMGQFIVWRSLDILREDSSRWTYCPVLKANLLLGSRCFFVIFNYRSMNCCLNASFIRQSLRPMWSLVLLCAQCIIGEQLH